ncbi:MAG TPA: hypothetical protein DCL41_09590 [Bdellovibrionales bacterium]|nr:hypothetical protein [Pseudobdellovibrionaceae bacterium]HAG92114.1 hypothetical protein [Bdellovibrionales bacterium]
MTSPSKKEFKIKVLPKKGAKDSARAQKKADVKASQSGKTSSSTSKSKGPKDLMGAAFAGVAAIALGGLVWFNLKESKTLPGPSKPSQVIQKSGDRKLTKYLQDSQRKRELQNLKTEVENLSAKKETLPDYIPPRKPRALQRPLGVELESDPGVDQVYEDLYGSQEGETIETPEDRISAQLANRKWLYDFQLEERKAYIRNFIEAARLAGYDIKIDENLVVTQVKPLTNRPKVPLDEVLQNLDP